MNPSQHTPIATHLEVDLARDDPPLGARIAVASRRAQGLPATVSDHAVRERLRALCALPHPPRESGVRRAK